MHESYNITLVMGDIGIDVTYRKGVDKYLWYLSGEESPERSLLELVLRSTYEEYIQKALDEAYKIKQEGYERVQDEPF